MDLQINEAEQQSAILVNLIEPIYRQHGIDVEVLEDLKNRASIVEEDCMILSQFVFCFALLNSSLCFSCYSSCSCG